MGNISRESNRGKKTIKKNWKRLLHFHINCLAIVTLYVIKKIMIIDEPLVAP